MRALHRRLAPFAATAAATFGGIAIPVNADMQLRASIAVGPNLSPACHPIAFGELARPLMILEGTERPSSEAAFQCLPNSDYLVNAQVNWGDGKTRTPLVLYSQPEVESSPTRPGGPITSETVKTAFVRTGSHYFGKGAASGRPYDVYKGTITAQLSPGGQMLSAPLETTVVARDTVRAIAHHVAAQRLHGRIARLYLPYQPMSVRLNARIQWGDGQTSTPALVPEPRAAHGSFGEWYDVRGAHTWEHPGTYIVTAHVRDSFGPQMLVARQRIVVR